LISFYLFLDFLALAVRMTSFEFKMKTWTNHGLSPLAAVGTDQANPNADGTTGPGGRYRYHLNGPEQYRPDGGAVPTPKREQVVPCHKR
jgi:hypothetical protein